jgi:hypothetical protein
MALRLKGANRLAESADRELAAEKEQRESRDQDAVAVAIETFEQLGQLGRETIRECVSNGVHLECQ